MAKGLEVTSLEDTFAIIFGDDMPSCIEDFGRFVDSFIPPSIDAAIVYATSEMRSDLPSPVAPPTGRRLPDGVWV